MYKYLNATSGVTESIDANGVQVYTIDISANRISESFAIDNSNHTGFTARAKTNITSGNIDVTLQYSNDNISFVDVVNAESNTVTLQMDETENDWILNVKNEGELLFGYYRFSITSNTGVGTLTITIDRG